MSQHSRFAYDLDWPLPPASHRGSSISSSTVDSETTSLLSLSQYPPSNSAVTSPGSYSPRKSSWTAPGNEVVRLDLSTSVTMYVSTYVPMLDLLLA